MLLDGAGFAPSATPGHAPRAGYVVWMVFTERGRNEADESRNDGREWKTVEAVSSMRLRERMRHEKAGKVRTGAAPA